MADQKTTAGKATTKTTAKTAQTSAQTVAPTVAPTRAESPAPTGTPVVTTAEASTATATASTTPTPVPTPAAERRIEYSRRLNVTINVTTVANAFHNVTASRSVRYVQYALHDRGFEPGNDQGRVDYDTRKAYAEFQRSIDEQPTGVPTAHSLNVLGFDVS